MNTKRKKLFSLLVAMLLIVQLVPLNAVLAAGDSAVKNSWLILHDTEGKSTPQFRTGGTDPDGVDDFSIKSGISIGGIPLTGTGDLQVDHVTPDTPVQITYGFHLLDNSSQDLDDEEVLYDEGSKFYISLPDGLDFTDGQHGDFVPFEGEDPTIPGIWTLDKANKRIIITLTGEPAFELRGTITLNGTVQPLGGDGDDSTVIYFGGQKVTIDREENGGPDPGGDETKADLEKEGSYDPATNKITWTVVAEAEAGSKLNGLTVTDTLAGTNHEYVTGSFKLKIDSGEAPDAAITPSGKTWSYTFPSGDDVDDITKAVFTFETTPTAGTNLGEIQHFQNDAVLTQGEVEIDTATDTVDFGVPITKGGVRYQPEAADDPTVLKWEVTVTIPSVAPHSEVLLKNAQIRDFMDKRIELIQGDTKYPITINFNETGSEAQTITTAADAANGNYTYTESTGSDTAHALVYYFPDATRPYTSSTATLTYYTKIKDLQSSLNDNDEISFENRASFYWELDSGSGNGPGQGPGHGGGNGITIDPEVEKGIISPAGGLIKKAPDKDSVVYQHSDGYDETKQNTDYIRWTVTVNTHQIDLGATPYITDTPLAGHEMVIPDSDHSKYPITYAVNGGTAQSFYTVKSGDGSSWTNEVGIRKVDASGFTFDLPAATGTPAKSDTYTITFYTKITNHDELYQNTNGTTTSHQTYQNEATLHYGLSKTAHAPATKTYQLQMLDKSVVQHYNHENRTAQWKLVVNRNGLPMTGAFLEDFLRDASVTEDKTGKIAYMPLDLASGFTIKATQPGQTTATETLTEAGTITDGGLLNGTKLEMVGEDWKLTFPATTSATFEITFWTKLTDEQLLKAKQGGNTYDNKAVLTLGPGVTITDTARTTVKNPVIVKDGAWNSEAAAISWKVEINAAKVTLQDAKISDTLENGMELISDSVELYAVQVNPDGTLTSPGTLVTSGYNVTEINGGKSFEIDLPDGATAYRLHFNTTVPAAGGSNFSNTITLEGTNGPSGSSTKNNINVDGAAAVGGMGSYALKFKKLDSEGNPIDGAQFKLVVASTNKEYRQKGQEFIRESDAAGIVTFDKLPSWSFKVMEVAPADGYLMPVNAASATGYSPTKITGTNPIGSVAATELKGLQPADVLYNALGKATVQIDKVGADNHPLSGGSFALYKLDDAGQPTADYAVTTSANPAAAETGSVTFTDVPFGRYYIKETGAPDGHEETAELIYVTVGYKKDNSKPGGLDYTQAEAAYESASGAPLTDPKLVNNPKTTGEENENPDVQFTKKSQSAHADRALEGVSFTLQAKSGTGTPILTPAKTAVSNTDGVVKFTNVPYGEYEIFETVPTGHLQPGNLSAPIYTVKVSYADSTNTKLKVEFFTPDDTAHDNPLIMPTYVNQLAVADVTFTKVSTAEAEADYGDPKIKINGGTFQIKGKPIAGFPGEPGKYEIDADGNYVATAEAVNGAVTFKDVPVNLTGEHYTITEITPPSGYQLTQDTLKVTVTYTDGNHTAVAVPAFENGLSVLKNTRSPSSPRSATISVLKTDEDGKKLAGAAFTLYNSADSAVATAVSGSNGIAEFTNVSPNSRYTIRETKAPAGYVLSSEVISVTTEANGAHSFTMVNKKIAVDAGAISVLKTDGAGAPLSGAEFTLYDRDGKAIEVRVTGPDGKILFDKLPIGEYTMVETRAPHGYILDSVSRKFTVSKDQTESLTVVNRSEQVPGPTMSQLQIIKVDSDRRPLAGAEFTLYSADGSVFAKATSGSDGLVVFTNIPIGSYTLRETAAPAGYQLFDEALPIEISANDTAKSYTLMNAALDEDPDIIDWEDNEVPRGEWPQGELPKTGGAAPSFFLLLAGLGLTAAGLVLKRTGAYRPKRHSK